MINLHESMGPGLDQTSDPWICSHACYWLRLRGQQSGIHLNIYSAKKVLHNRGLWQFISNTGNTRLRDLYQHLVPSLRSILFETESKPQEKCQRNMCLMVPGVGNQKWQNDRFSMLYSVSDSARDYLVNSTSKITSPFWCKNLHEFNKCLTNNIPTAFFEWFFFVKKYAS